MFCPTLSSVGSVGQAFEQFRASVQGFERSAMRLSSFFRSGASSSSETQRVQQPQKTQTHIFAMTADEVQANSDTVTSTMFIFGTFC